MNEKWSLSDLKLTKQDEGRYYLSAEYTVETDKDIRKLVIPHISLPLVERPIIENHYFYGESITVDLGLGALSVLKDITDVSDNPIFYYEKVIKTKTKEMTLEEIEEKLGHKVKIVNKKEG